LGVLRLLVCTPMGEDIRVRKLARYFDDLDSNHDGLLDESDLAQAAERYLDALGLDPDSLQAEAGHTYYFEGVLEKVERSKRQRLNRVEADRFERTSFKLAPSEPGLAGLGPADPDPFQ